MSLIQIHNAETGETVVREMTSDEVAASQPNRNDDIKAQIADIESRQSRAVREALLGIDGASARLQALENDIAALRGQLQ